MSASDPFDPFSKDKPGKSETFNSLDDALESVSHSPTVQRTRTSAFRPLTRQEKERAGMNRKETTK